MKKILVTGGAGFAGSNLAILFKSRFPETHVVAFDNLKRRGSELILPRLRAAGVEFAHGDVRVKEDLLEHGEAELLLDCAAEPSVMAGINGAPSYVIDTNLKGTLNCLEYARLFRSKIIFLSTSRVYPVAQLNALEYVEEETRFNLKSKQSVAGASLKGISEDFPLAGARTLYGASKLCSELMLQEYLDSYKLQAIINRCGVLTGPWQMGKVDQGVVVLWAAKHIYNKPLSYIGFGGAGKQVRDILHISDLFSLLLLQLEKIDQISGRIFNIGGGVERSVSLAELTTLCHEITGNVVPLQRQAETRAGDIRYFVTDSSRAHLELGWKPAHSVPATIEEICRWIRDNQVALEPILA
ncbi:MAG: NAD-dependent epimerase/dehydratase family protein [Oligoflexia bacterium]|nr:NAD-dependent epimerase/dehydratase family protein [Oligoflexia bacterium]